MAQREVLIIEDNEQNMYLVSFLLRKNGYGVLEAYDGPDGVRMAQEHQPSLILLDIQLPGMDGFEVVRQLRADAKLNNVPIIAVTSQAMAGDRDRVLAGGCDAYIQKPIDPDSFISEIEQHLARRR